MTLFNKYRPTVLKQFVGNMTQVQMIQKKLQNQDKPHAWVISGPSGTGKTTMARIMASLVQAEVVKELNASDTNGVDDMRDIIESMRYPIPTAYILDEAHKLSTSAQSALLKPLEDTPTYTYFFLCTTDPQKLSVALKNRCTIVEMKPLNEDDMLTLLRQVSKAEGVKMDADTFDAIIIRAEGSARRALVLLESVIDVEDIAQRRSILGEVEEESRKTIELCRILLDNSLKWEYISRIISNLETTDWESVRYAVLGYMSSVQLNGFNRRAVWALECFKEPYYATGKAGLVLSCSNFLIRTKE
jgi:DNA polymerase III gamma/tau subunit